MSLRARLGFGIVFASLLGSACTPAPPGASDGRGAGGSDSGTPQGGSTASSAGGSAGNAGNASNAGSGTAGGATSGGTGSTSVAPPAPWQAPGTSLISNTAACNASQTSVGRAPLRRISRIEYNNMVRDLLGDQSRPADGFVSEEKVVGFNSNSYTGVNPLIMRQYWDAADKLATAAATNYLNLLGCGSSVTDACIQGYIAKVAKRAYRGNFDDATAQALFTLYTDTKTQFDVQTGVQAVLTQVLTSPRFLFMFEFGQGSPSGTQQPLSAWEVAARLAAFLWRSVPDDTLAQAADQNQLTTADRNRSAGHAHARRRQGQVGARRLRRPVARHRERGQRHQGHRVRQRLVAPGCQGPAHRDHHHLYEPGQLGRKLHRLDDVEHQLHQLDAGHVLRRGVARLRLRGVAGGAVPQGHSDAWQLLVGARSHGAAVSDFARQDHSLEHHVQARAAA
ncbi:MAG: DUF1587 domain-containing protein [Polyangiaceae bacterium]